MLCMRVIPRALYAQAPTAAPENLRKALCETQSKNASSLTSFPAHVAEALGSRLSLRKPGAGRSSETEACFCSLRGQGLGELTSHTSQKMSSRKKQSLCYFLPKVSCHMCLRLQGSVRVSDALSRPRLWKVE